MNESQAGKKLSLACFTLTLRAILLGIKCIVRAFSGIFSMYLCIFQLECIYARVFPL